MEDSRPATSFGNPDQGISRSISAKADRLCNSHRVILLGQTKALVIGDHDTYDVIKLSFRWSCNCTWGRYKSHGGDCSHIVAVRRALKNPRCQAPVARLAEILHNTLNSMEVA
ncbi:MAG: hypothetical protein KIS61_25290 [Candidatus Eremiobacteraeota bacterium]|nr:hypothetical protein [Candidatus Eremiobacteraeota bacterium]